MVEKQQEEREKEEEKDVIEDDISVLKYFKSEMHFGKFLHEK